MQEKNGRRAQEGPVIPIMLALLAGGIAALIYVVQPAHEEYEQTHRDEMHLHREISRMEAERGRLEVLARGLDDDPRVIERVQRNLGAGKPGEVRYVRASTSRPAK
jgi:cell division protein FtsB